MSFLVGKNEQMSNVTPETQGLHKMLIDFLEGGGSLDRLFPSVQPDKASQQPYLDMFTQQNARNFAQAKESAGNLTGSGLASLIGQEAGRANVDQGAFLAKLFEDRRTEDANRFASILLGALSSPAGGVTNTYTPGALDYLAQGATGLASGGAFNNLFKRNQQPGG